MNSRLICLIVATLFLPIQALAAPFCDKRETIVSGLASKYSEYIIGRGYESRGALLELLAAEDGSTWTVIISSPDGRACLVASGENWRREIPKKEAQGKPL